jgi:hypothetical protein
MNKELFSLRIRDAAAAYALGEMIFNAKMSRDAAIFWKDFVRDNFDFSLNHRQ